VLDLKSGGIKAIEHTKVIRLDADPLWECNFLEADLPIVDEYLISFE